MGILDVPAISPAELDAACERTSIARVTPSRHAPALGLYFPEAEGGLGDGRTDDTAAVLAAFAKASATKTLTIGGNSYAPGATVQLERRYNLASLSGPIVASCNIAGRHGTLVAPATYADAVLLVGHDISGKLLHNAKMELPNITKDKAVGLTQGSVAVQVQNLYNSDIVAGRTTYFETGLWFTGLGMGAAYNRIHIGWVDLCKVALRLAPRAGGWVNQNTFIGGNVSQSPNTLDGGSTGDKRRDGYRHLVLDGKKINTVNGNTFDGISFEGDLSEYVFEVRYATHNVWQGSTRFEQGSDATATTLVGDTFTTTGHGLRVGDMVVFLATGSRPGGMNTGVPYFVASVEDASTFKVAASKAGAAASFTSNGAGVLYYTPPRLLFDGSGGHTYNNELRSGYYSFPGPLDIRYTNASKDNVVAPSIAMLGDLMPGRNRVLNGNFRVNQRGYVSGASMDAGSFCFDRWKAGAPGTTVTFTPASSGQAVFLNSGSIAQVVELANVEPGTYILSWRGSATGRAYNSGAEPPAYSVSPITVDIDGIADVVIEFSNGRVEMVQLERGMVATPFERMSLGAALVLCKRYFQRLGAATGTAVREPIGIGAATTSKSAVVVIPLPVEMRTTPTLRSTNPSTLRVIDANVVIHPTAVRLGRSSPKNLRLSVSVASGLTAGHSIFIDTGDHNAVLDLSAEL